MRAVREVDIQFQFMNIFDWVSNMIKFGTGYTRSLTFSQTKSKGVMSDDRGDMKLARSIQSNVLEWFGLKKFTYS